MILQRRASWFALGVALFLGGCGGGANAPFVSGAPAGSRETAARGVKASFAILVPHKRRHRGAHYVSPNTQSISIALTKSPSGKTARTIKQNLTPASSGCVAVAGGTQCTITVLLAAGQYTALVSTYDATDQGGNVLSQDQSVPFKVIAKKANQLAFVLGGVPHSLSIAGTTQFVRTTSGGVSVFGASAGPVTVTATDADGNTIVGPDSLHYSASVVSGSGWSVQATPDPASPNTFSVTPPGTNGSSASIQIAFAVDSATCAQSGVVCSKTFTASNRVQYLATIVCGANCGFTGATDSINIFKLPNTTTPFATVTNGVFQPLAVAFAPDGTLYVGNCKSSLCPNGPFSGTDTVTVYAPPYTGTPVTITSNVHFPALLAVNKDGDAFVDDCQSCNFGIDDPVTWYKHGSFAYQGTLNPTATIDAMGAGPNGTLMVGTCAHSCGYASADAVLQYSYPTYPDSPVPITDGVADVSALAFDNAGNMLVANCTACMTTPVYSVTKYAPGGTSPIATITGGACGTPPFVCAPTSVAADSSDDVFVGNGPGGATNENVAEFLAPGYGGNGTLFFNGLGYQPEEMLVDAVDDIFVSDTDTVQLSPPPYSTMTPVPSRPDATIHTYQGYALSP
jgi:hypothetical protein